MNLLLEIIFIALVIADCILTYKVIRSGKGREAAFAKCYIKYPVATVTFTTIGLVIILDLIIESHFYLLLLPLIAVFGYAVWKNWRVWNG
jgi:hypothetical protein